MEYLLSIILYRVRPLKYCCHICWKHSAVILTLYVAERLMKNNDARGRFVRKECRVHNNKAVLLQLSRVCRERNVCFISLATDFVEYIMHCDVGTNKLYAFKRVMCVCDIYVQYTHCCCYKNKRTARYNYFDHLVCCKQWPEKVLKSCLWPRRTRVWWNFVKSYEVCWIKKSLKTTVTQHYNTISKKSNIRSCLQNA